MFQSCNLSGWIFFKNPVLLFFAPDSEEVKMFHLVSIKCIFTFDNNLTAKLILLLEFLQLCSMKKKELKEFYFPFILPLNWKRKKDKCCNFFLPSRIPAGFKNSFQKTKYHHELKLEMKKYGFQYPALQQ